MEKPVLTRGSVLSYSSGSQDRGPYGFRLVRQGGNMLETVRSRWPGVVERFGDRLPVVINAYPAHIGTFDFGVTIDTYMSHATGGRALQLAQMENLPVMLLGQPLYLADLLFRYLEKERPLPDAIMILTGGYVMPNSLEKALREACAAVGTHLTLLHGYGVAEVDAACLLATERNSAGELVYVRRGDDVEVEFDGEDLLLSRRLPSGEYASKRFPTGDCGRPEGDGYLIWNNQRLHPDVRMLLEGWSTEDWKRRTGYLYFGRGFRIQLRKGNEPKMALESEFYDYAKKFGQSWLFKPEWKQQIQDEGDPIQRRTLV